MNSYSNNYYSKFNFDIISLGKLPRGWTDRQTDWFTCRTLANRVKTHILLSGEDSLAHQWSRCPQFFKIAATSCTPCCLQVARSLKLWSNMPFKTVLTCNVGYWKYAILTALYVIQLLYRGTKTQNVQDKQLISTFLRWFS